MDTIIQILARELGRSEAHVENVVRLIDEGNTIPFIARYRKTIILNRRCIVHVTSASHV